MKRLFFIILSLTFCFTFAHADHLIGRVTDADNDNPIEQVSVSLQNINLSAVTNSDGEYIINIQKPGIYYIVFERIGYEKKVVKHNLFEDNILNISLKSKPQKISGVLVSSTKAKDRETPVTYYNLEQEEVLRNNYGQEIPMLLEDVPGVYSYSDAGSMIGNAYLKIRGFDQKRIGVMINGIPLNDPEDHNVYWVNMPDFAENTSNIQFQRGVGSSLYGISTFGGSLNMQTAAYTKEEVTEIFANYGSYNTYKSGIKLGRKFSNYSTAVRFSQIGSDGYRDNSASELWSVFANVSRMGHKSLTSLNFYTGHELTHAAWEASGEWELEENHQHNPYTYDNYVDDFSQPHFELHHNYFLSENSDLQNSIFYIRGEGFYEQYKDYRNLWEHGLVDVDNAEEADIIRQKWVTKNHFGWVSQYNFEHKMGKFTAGTYLSGFDSDHWGEIKEVIGADTLDIEYEKGQKYYNYTGNKQYLTAYVNEIFRPVDDVSIMANLYFQYINYDFEQKETGNFSGELLNSYQVDYNFVNPRFGANYNINDDLNIYGNISISQREPTDDELYDTWDGPDDLGVAPLFATSDTIFVDDQIDHIVWSDPYVKPEKLIDYELGLGYTIGILDFDLNGYWMNFEDEIVAYGNADDEGNPIRGNADRTVHRGIESSILLQLPANFKFAGSFSYSDNYFEKFIMKDWDENWNVVDIELTGNTIAGFPSIITSGKLNYSNEIINAFAQLQYIGKQYLDNTENEDRIIEPYKLVNVGLNYNIATLLGWDTKIILNARVNNIFDEIYETAGYYDPWGGENGEGANYYWPAAGRNVAAGLRVSF